MSRVVAVIVTYKRPELLRRCVEAALRQTRRPDLVLIVDNDRMARQALDDYLPNGKARLEVIETGSNLGPAGGYEIGFRLALERGADKIWTLDDDDEPMPDCLEKLLAAGGAIVTPLEIRPSGWEGFAGSWNGGLIDSEVVRRVGPPRRELFFWAEDTEFFLRAKLAGFLRQREPAAIVKHAQPDARRPGVARNWRLYYEIRNTLYVRLKVRDASPRQAYRASLSVLGKPLRILLFEPGKRDSMRLWWWGVRDFLRGRLGKVVDPEDHR
ncbi:MAG: glycosyltransferase [Actinomycetota bacterium]